MSSTDCVVVTETDRKIASKVRGWNAFTVAYLRDIARSKEKDITDVDELLAFKESLDAKDHKAWTNAVINPVAAYDQLQDAFSTQTRVDRVNMMATLFSYIVDSIQEENPYVSREDIIKGFTDKDGKFQGGPAAIWMEVHKSLEEDMQESDEETARKYEQIFDNWGALVIYANSVIRDTEGISIGNNLTFASPTDFTGYEDGTLVESFTADEAKRESWQEVSESISPFGSASVLVRRVLGRLRDYESEKEEDYDDLGYPRRVSAVTAHQTIMEILRGMQSEGDMMTLLRENAGNISYLNALIEELDSNPLLRTQFFVDFSKTFQTYSMQRESWLNGIVTFKNVILNFVTRSDAYDRYLAALDAGTLNDLGGTAIFYYDEERKAKVEDRILDQWLNTIREKLGDGTNIFQSATEKGFDNLSNEEREMFYRAVLTPLGIVLSSADYALLVKNNKSVIALNKVLKDILTQTQSGNKLKGIKDYKTLLSKKIGTNASEGFLQEKIGKILKITTNLSSSKDVLSRIRFHNNTYYSDIRSSYLGRFKDTIEAFARRGNTKGLRSFLETRFFKNPFFYDPETGKILNKWLEDLYNSDLSESDSFANMFTYTKLLGDDIQKFEDFMTRKQALTLINEYFSESQEYARYPVFILGDSGASKWIRARRYSSEEIIDGLYNVYLQEIKFRNRLGDLKTSLEKEGKSLGSLEGITDKFSLLPFLNDPKVQERIDKNNLEDSVKELIREHLDKAFKEYMSKLESVGALETREIINDENETVRYKSLERFKYLDKLSIYTTKKGKKLSGREAVEASLREYFYNSKFASTMQMELMTISPAFYRDGDSLDLQKRYKEIHASGDRLSLDAEDPFNGGKYSEDRPYQTTVYVEDVKLNMEEVDPAFMEVIAKIHGKDSEAYKAYTRTTLTDGQGWRTLKSYRAVMGMAGKWNSQCEDAYKRIEEIRKEIRDNAKTGERGEANEAQMKELAELMVTFQPIKPFLYTLETITIGDEEFHIPVQLKYAETVMIPELMAKDSKLRHMLEWAENREGESVDLIVATTAVKVGSFGAANIQSATQETLAEELNNAIVHKLNREDYVIQTNLPEHIQGSQLFATQSRKLIPAGLKATDDAGNTIYYGHYIGRETVDLGEGQVKLNAYNLNRFYVGLIAANMLEDFDKFAHMIEDPEKVRNVLVQMTINNSRESLDNLRGYSRGLEGDFLMPLFEGGIEHDTAALLLSIFKKQVNKQKINGGSAVQVSAFGITGYEEKDNLHFVTNADNTNILYAECEIPWDLSYTDNSGNRIDLQFSDWCESDGSLKLSDEVINEKDPRYWDYYSYQDSAGRVRVPKIEQKYPGILSFIAYRIPTEEKYSMLNIKVKRFTLKVNGGGTIKVPAQGTTIAGFDFDADKLYFMRREFRYSGKLTDKQIEEIWKKIYDKNPNIYNRLKDIRDALETLNEFFSELTHSEIAAGMIEDSKTKTRLYQYWKEAGLEGSPEQIFSEYLNAHIDEYLELDSFDFEKTPWDESQSRVARNNVLITLMQKRLEDPQTLKTRTTPGGFAHVSEAAKRLMELMGINNTNYDYSDPWTMVIYNQQNQVADKLIGIFANQNTNHAMASLMKTFKLKEPIAFGSHSAEGLSDLLNSEALTRELLAAAVDAVKDPVLSFFNLNTITADSTGMLCRLGYSFYDIGLLFNQPIIKDLCEYCMNNNIFDVNTAINHILNIWGVRGDYADKPSSNLTQKSLEEGILDYTKDQKKAREDGSFIYKQAQVLMLFANIYNTAKEVSAFVTNTKFTASNAVKSTFGGMYAQQDKVARYIESLQDNSESSKIVLEVSDESALPIRKDLSLESKEARGKYMKEIMKNPFGYEQVMYDANVAALKKLNKYYPYDTGTYSAAREFMSRLTKSGLNAETIDQIHAELLRFMIAQNESSKFNPESEIEGMSAKDYYTRVVPYRILNLRAKHKELRNLPIFSHLISTERNDVLSIKLDDAGALIPTQKEGIRDSWEGLINEEFPEVSGRRVAEDLYMYSYYKSGFGFGAIGFNHLAPLSLKLGLVVNQASEGIPQYTYTDFLNQVLANGIPVDNSSFAVEFLSNHRDNRSLVYEPKSEQYTYIRNKVFDSILPSDSFTIDTEGNGINSKIAPFVLRTSGKDVYFKPAILIDGLLYVAGHRMFDGSTESIRFNNKIESGESIEYVLVKRDNSKQLTVEEAKRVYKNAQEQSSTSIIDEDFSDNMMGGIGLRAEENPFSYHSSNVTRDVLNEYDENGRECRDEFGNRIC